ncbi:hypothetical protein SNEBB_005051 [Seison nebaliae]|nr:hypothetical protein SNEBB_005051 [Seison nebaliae]
MLKGFNNSNTNINNLNQNVNETNEEEQLKVLAINTVKQHAFQMQKSLDKGQILNAIHHVAMMTEELRTSLLSPKHYYELYIAVTNELTQLEILLTDEFRKGNRISDLYELVQYTTHIIPRLYMMIVVGVVFIRTHEMSRKEILLDLVEMCRGVQHPLRGLFLRNFLLTATRDILPFRVNEINVDNKNHGQGDGDEDDKEMDGNLDDTLHFILTNFTEMNKLWVRMQHQGHTRDRQKREKERMDLCILIGSNLNLLSNQPTVTLDIYQNKILPVIIDQIRRCNDAIAQKYLFDCVIQVFPDDFHFQTVEILLNSIVHIHDDVFFGVILNPLIERFIRYYDMQIAESVVNPTELIEEQISKLSLKEKIEGFRPNEMITLLSHLNSSNLIEMLRMNILQIAKEREKKEKDIPELLEMQTILLQLAFKLYPNENHLHELILKMTDDLLKEYNIDHIFDESKISKKLKEFLTLPISVLNDICRVLALKDYVPLFDRLDWQARCLLSIDILTNIIENQTKIIEIDSLKNLLRLIESLLIDQIDQIHPRTWSSLSRKADEETGEEVEEDVQMDFQPDQLQKSANELFANEEFIEQQYLIAKLVHQTSSCELKPEKQLEIFQCLQETFIKGGPVRVRFTLTSLVSEICNYCKNCWELHREDEELGEKYLLFTKEVIESLVTEGNLVSGGVDISKMPSISAIIRNDESNVRSNDLNETVLRLYLLATSIGNYVNCENSEAYVYEFFSNAFTLYEEELGDSKAQVNAFALIIGTFCQIKCLTEENHEPLRAQSCLAASKLLKKPDQCHAILQCTNIYSKSYIRTNKDDVQVYHNDKRVFDCLMKARRVTSQCLDKIIQAQLSIEILENILIHYQQKNEYIKIDDIDQIVTKIYDCINGITSTISNNNRSVISDLTIQLKSIDGHIKKIVEENNDDEHLKNFENIKFNLKGMFSFLKIIYLFAVCYSTTSTSVVDSKFNDDDPSKLNCEKMFCRKQFQPVCSVQNITYNNMCELNVAKCYEYSIQFKHDGPCDKQITKTSCFRNCFNDISTYKVCANSLELYNNMCEFKNDKCNNRKLSTVASKWCNLSKAQKEIDDVEEEKPPIDPVPLSLQVDSPLDRSLSRRGRSLNYPSKKRFNGRRYQPRISPNIQRGRLYKFLKRQQRTIRNSRNLKRTRRARTRTNMKRDLKKTNYLKKLCKADIDFGYCDNEYHRQDKAMMWEMHGKNKHDEFFAMRYRLLEKYVQEHSLSFFGHNNLQYRTFYYYNWQKKTCEKFPFFGCGSRNTLKNRFVDSQICEMTCSFPEQQKRRGKFI